MNNFLAKSFILFILITMSIIVAILIIKSRKPIEHVDNVVSRKPVQVIIAEPIPFRAQVTAYGTVEPAISFHGKTEVSGKISYVHADLKRGNSIAADTVVVKIDPEDYQVNLRQTQALLAANQSALAQLQEEEKTTQESLTLAQENLAVGEQELKRVQKLWDKRVVARSVLDKEEQKVLQLRQQVAELQGRLNTYTSRAASINAQIEQAQQQVKGQRTTLGRTEIKMPFTARIGEVMIEKGEFVAVGATLFEALDVQGVEIIAQLPVMHMRKLVSHLAGAVFDTQQANYVQNALQSLDLKAQVRLVGGPAAAKWHGRVLRIGESIDPTRRTVSIVVGVDDPYEQVIPGQRPPLLKGMYTAVELSAPVREALVIPRKAIHQGRVYVVNDKDELGIQAVTIDFHQGDLTVLDSGLTAQTQVIITDLIPIIKGMPLAPQIDETATQKLRSRAVRASIS